MSASSRAAAIAVLALFGFAAEAVHAATCKEPITTRSRSAVHGSDKYRETRARDNAIKHWRTNAQHAYGIGYRFWSRAKDRKVDCSGGAKSRLCVATATPCSLF